MVLPSSKSGTSKKLIGRSRTAQNNKHTPNVRKILQSQKTFANHLDDYQALLVLAETNPAAAAALNPAGIQPKATPAAAAAPAAAATPVKNSPAPQASKDAGAGLGTSAGTSKRAAAAAKRAAAREAKAAKQAAAAAKAEVQPPDLESEPTSKINDGSGGGGVDGDVDMTDVSEALPSTTSAPEQEQDKAETQPQAYPADGTILPAYQRPPPAPHPGDDDVLLASRVPPFPTDDELRALMTAPPLSYLEARAGWGDEEARYPVRIFCELCGYWGRVRCMKCGARVCALDCLEAHREECVTRYGL